MKNPCVYILSNRRRGALYVGMTTDITTRLQQHLETEKTSYVRRYGIDRLVFVEFFPEIDEAAAAEMKIKKWHRDWKFGLIEKDNPEWECLKKAL